jgi:hypothetical protein
MRRDFLKYCGLAGLGLALFPSLAAEGARRRRRTRTSRIRVRTTSCFNASGGWDTTYLMDPKGINGSTGSTRKATS